MNPEITIIGFPKCGTSALARCFEDDAEMRVLRAPDQALEVNWPLIRKIRPEPEPGRILVHKCAAYIYSRKALEYLAGINPDSLLVLCIRDPLRALVSWHNMHRSIARTGRSPSHFAWKERDFYADCTLDNYYKRFARDRLQYDRYLAAMLGIVPRARVAVVAQERMAEGIREIADFLKSQARGNPVPGPELNSVPVSKHEGYADKANIEITEYFRKELENTRTRLLAMVEADVIHKCI